MSNDEKLTPLGAEIMAGLTAFRDALEAGLPIEKHFTVRTITFDLQSKPYSAADVKQVRTTLKASQPIFAKFLGVSVKTLRSWEQGLRPVPNMACRFMDEIVQNPTIWTNRFREATENSLKVVES